MDAFAQEQIQGLLEQHAGAAFLVDFDGTMVDLVPDPDGVHVPGELIRDLDVISRNGTCAFAIVTGRALFRLDSFLKNVFPVAVGSHGAELRSSHAGQILPLAPLMPAATRLGVEVIGARHDCFFEDKGYSLSLHLPPADMGKDLLPELTEALGADARSYFIRKVGRTYEILQQGITKGSGIVHLMKQPGFAGRKPVYIGDDVGTDESLEIVSRMGGVLLPALHVHQAALSAGGPFLGTNDVRRIIAALAGT